MPPNLKTGLPEERVFLEPEFPPEETENILNPPSRVYPLERSPQLARTGRAPVFFLGLFLVGLLWKILSASGLIPPYLLPSPEKVADSWLRLFNSGLLGRHVGATLAEAGLGFLGAFLLSVTLAYFTARSDWLTWLLAPFIAATQAMPIIALAPVLVMWFGLGLSSKVIICGLIVFFPILVNTVAGLRTVDREMLAAASSQGANAWQIFWYIEVPLSLRTLLGGLKVGLTLSLTGAVVGEFVASDAGLGFLMLLSRTNYDSAMLFASAFTLACLAILFYVAVGILENLLIDW